MTHQAELRQPTICIHYPLSDMPWGGANQFLRALRDRIAARGLLTSDLEQADIVLLNGNPGTIKNNLRLIRELRKISDHSVVVIRMDGPVTHRDHALIQNNWLYMLCNYYADGIIFQSKWSRENNYRLGMSRPPLETLVTNAPDPKLFHPVARRKAHDKVRCIATSWSSNMMKGFGDYLFLDENLDFSTFEFTFVGNSPYHFKNIKIVPPMTSKALGALLRKQDIFVTASVNDACSNSVIEALHSGLPVVYVQSGGHAELVKRNGLPYTNKRELLFAIQEVSENYEKYSQNFTQPNIDEVTKQYIEFMQKVFASCATNPKRPGVTGTSSMLWQLFLIYAAHNTDIFCRKKLWRAR